MQDNTPDTVHKGILERFETLLNEYFQTDKPQANGTKLGKPKDTLQKSKFDKDEHCTKELLSLGLSARKISKLLGYSNHISLNAYINKQNLRP